MSTDPLAAFLKGAVPPDDGAAPAQRPDAAKRWRQELERAQWATKKPAAPPAASSPARPAAGPAAASSRAGARERSESTADGAARSAAGRQRQTESSPLPARTAPGSVAAVSRQPASFTAVAQATPRMQDAGGAPRQAEGAPRPQRVVWPEVNAHLIVRDGKADVWVRDASLGERARRRLAAELKQRLREAGLRPGALYLNGEQIDFH